MGRRRRIIHTSCVCAVLVSFQHSKIKACSREERKNTTQRRWWRPGTDHAIQLLSMYSWCDILKNAINVYLYRPAPVYIRVPIIYNQILLIYCQRRRRSDSSRVVYLYLCASFAKLLFSLAEFAYNDDRAELPNDTHFVLSLSKIDTQHTHTHSHNTHHRHHFMFVSFLFLFFG